MKYQVLSLGRGKCVALNAFCVTKMSVILFISFIYQLLCNRVLDI